MALLIRGSELDPRWVRNKRPRSTESGATRARAFEPILEPTGSRAPHMSCSRASRAASRGDPIGGELSHPRSLANGTEPHLANPRERFHGRVSGPRANPYRTEHGHPLELPNNSSTRNPQSATRSMGVVETSPSVPRRDGEGTYYCKSESSPRSPRTGPGSGARRMATPPRVHRMQEIPIVLA
jgi:hypothetical protein